MGKLKFVNCPNCNTTFNKDSLFEKDEYGFTCNKCGYSFEYPNKNNLFVNRLVTGLLLIFVLPSVLKLLIIWVSDDYDYDFATPGYLLFTIAILGIGIYGLVDGIKKIIKNNSLKTNCPDWEVRRHNTEQKIVQLDIPEEVETPEQKVDAEESSEEDIETNKNIGCFGIILSVLIALVIVFILAIILDRLSLIS